MANLSASESSSVITVRDEEFTVLANGQSIVE